ncbi:PP2C family protein-serine/threonine phosphatase [Streptomyces sp. V4-01]|uniref:PP2C family protein-serine/threonine phosphatase n=1 Tax=Actinacidiphila polyblastidii TaxID=3110430 RepID=A0ABU7P3X5_9ACTN|nr:PP2C family protein-serine/threonine phosphatase [Streptomyces sp. V4-01]
MSHSPFLLSAGRRTSEKTQAGIGVFLLSAALIVAVPVADLFTSPTIHLAHILVVPVALVAAFCGPRRGALAALLAVVALIAAGAERHMLSTENVLVQLGSLVALSGLLVFFGGLQERRRRELERLRRVSDTAQNVVLRALPHRAGPLSLAAEYRAAEVGTSVGGDLYAVARTAHATRVLIGDVRGHGLDSLSGTETVLGAFRAIAHRQEPLPELVADLEASVRWGLAEQLDEQPGDGVGERFATAAVVEIPDDEPYVRVVSCGHLPPLRIRDGGAQFLEVEQTSPPLGLGALADGPYTPATFDFAPGDRLLLYTDGVTEARDADGRFFPLRERAEAHAARRRPDALVESLTHDVLAHVAGRRDDDMALVALRREPADRAAPGRRARRA